jgi:hypothetical protein
MKCPYCDYESLNQLNTVNYCRSCGDPRSADYLKRHKEFDQFTYDEIFWKIWKPVKSFYKEYK